jgi:hypothetical protein
MVVVAERVVAAEWLEGALGVAVMAERVQLLAALDRWGERSAEQR